MPEYGLGGSGSLPGSQTVIEDCTPAAYRRPSDAMPSRNFPSTPQPASARTTPGGSRLRQIELKSDRNARLPGCHRQAYGHAAVLLFAQLPAVLPGYADGMTSFFGKARVVHHPAGYRTPPAHRRKRIPANLVEDPIVAPRRIRHQMMQSLVHAANVARFQPGRHRLDALPFPDKQQPDRSSSSSESCDRRGPRLSPRFPCTKRIASAALRM